MTKVKNKYKCPKYCKIVERDSDKAWITSVCIETGITTRIIKQGKKK